MENINIGANAPEYYWEIITFDGTVVEIKPNAVDKVKKRLEDKQVIHTINLSIPANQVKVFRRTDKLFEPVNLLKAVNRVFFEPKLNPDGSIHVKWVKKFMPKQIYERKYSAIPAYKLLDVNGGLAVVAFRLPEHQIDTDKVDLCTADEVKKLTNQSNLII